MGIYSTKPVKEISKDEFRLLIKGKKVVVSPHAIWHLSHRQRKVFNVRGTYKHGREGKSPKGVSSGK